MQSEGEVRGGVASSSQISPQKRLDIMWGVPERFPQVMLQRDLLSGALSSRARVACYLLQILECWVGRGMTAVLQVLDV